MADEEKQTQYSVLIVDDNVNNLQIAAKIISKAGYEVFIAADGESALEILDTVIPHAILLDIMMPRMSGLEVCKKIKEKPEFSNVPVLFISAIGEDADIEKGLQIGGADYITKPFRERVLLARLRLHIEKGVFEKKIAEKNNDLLGKNHQLKQMQERVITVNEALEKQIRKNLEIFAIMNDLIRNPLSVAMTMLELNEDTKSDKIIEQLQRIDKAVDDMDRGFLESDKIVSYLKKHYPVCE